MPRVPRLPAAHRGLALLLALALAGGLAAVVRSGTARADFFSTSPGPLSHGHANLDDKEKCQECHVGSRDVSADKCLACHKPIAERQRDHRGVHAQPKAIGKPCELCHTEHKGRGKDIMGFQSFGGRDKFDHAITGFPLDGAHARTECNKCHTQKTQTGTQTFLKASKLCASCHENPHGEMRESLRRCERCHDAQNWKQLDRLDFNHDKDARFPIEKKHEGVPCVQCHAKRGGDSPPTIKGLKASPPRRSDKGYDRLTFRWGGSAVDCQPCHDNVHGESLFGQKSCKLCHSAKVEFTRISFDHNRRTRFPLDGAHADPRKATCESCHKKEERKPPSRACDACHQDVHKDRFDKVSNRDCGVCHSSNNFQTDIRFDHGARTKFPLTGAHAAADCRACHRGKSPSDYEKLDNIMVSTGSGKRATTSVACMNCHRHENVHQKQYPNERCLECHKMAGVVETKPRAVNEFHGPQSKFPLTEGHAGVPCAKCHPGNVFKKTPLVCGPACHPDDLHKGTLGPDCLKCHAGGKWEARLFDHDKDTKWPLVGNHKDVLCDSCHPRRDFANNRGKSNTCYNCHAKDDRHQGHLGERCEVCHNPDGKILFNHNDPDKSDWPLNGRHKKVRCADCHISITFKPTRRDCGGCHPEPDVHRGQLGTFCSSCHVETGWNNVRTGHDVPTPRFGGAHDQIACVKCHPAGRLLAGTANLCINCHRQDDVHHNVLGPNCGECHTQRTWAGARFEHSRVGCDLVGVHRLLPCVQCHVGGNYMSLSPTCVSCHRKDAIRGAGAPGAPMGHQNYGTCSNCHNPNFFGPMSQGSNRESVCR